ncbi:hypothetical protein SNOG_12298 [Parastagonospora nodorum SN15]|uniref:Uncharacterized protein n=1 Tax=Phaeosphaeria nodorum (strain SN15 / ATCC MYA-4574 / FGSC 10173) TaxID=321614 RepID=Q0U7G6_PHANO|nr:hypothetical protein SNOG_12298 [Parastagonospora nodorum SN15]EAT80111.1 hypothetical protein SNOG_12298 [Parastagonospora nodorum SN15]
MCRIIPAFPNEITLIILHELPLADLVIWISKKHDVDDATRFAWVQNQWTETYAKMETNETSAEDFWSHIEVNPLLLSLDTPFRRTKTAERDAIGYDTLCFPRQKIFYEVPGKSNLTSFQAASISRMTKVFNCFGFATKPHFHMTPGSLTDLDVELFLPCTVRTDLSEARPDSGVKIAPLPALTISTTSVSTRKTVRFYEGVKRRLYDLSGPAKGVNTPLDKRNWEPLMGGAAYPGSAIPIGFDSIFISTSLKTIALKRRVLNRFKAVQEYEKRRRQAAIAFGDDNPPLDQLEYGNADHKLALQATKVITIDDIGTFMSPLELGIPPTT